MRDPHRVGQPTTTCDDARRKTAVIVNAYSYKNAGDAAIMLSTARVMRDLGFHNVTLATRYDDEQALYDRWNIRVEPAPIPFLQAGSGSSIKRTIGFFVPAILALVIFSFPKSLTRSRGMQHATQLLIPTMTSFLKADALVVAGGGYLYSSQRRVNLSLAHSALMIWLVRRSGTDAFVMPSSVGPIHRRFDRFLIERAIGSMDFVARETLSLDNGLKSPRSLNLVRCPDVAFLAPIEMEDRGAGSANPSGTNRSLVRLVAMDWTWSRSVKSAQYRKYLQEMATLSDGLQDRGYEVELGGHSALDGHHQNDIDVCNEVQKLCRRPVTVDDNSDILHLYERYQESSLVIGTRLHACIIAISVGTPAICIGYQEKAQGVARSVANAIPVFAADAFCASDVFKCVDNTIRAGATEARLLATLRIAEVYREA